MNPDSANPTSPSVRNRNAGSLLIICALIGLSLFTIRLIYTPGCAWETHDMMFNMERFSAAQHAFSQGHLSARWSRDINYGYGYPLLLFYPPLTVYVIGLLHAAGLGFLTATKTLVTLSMILAGILAWQLGFYLWKDRISATLTAVCYLLLPYHLLTIMTRGAIAEFTAQGLLPGLMLTYLRLQESSHRRLIPATLFCAAVILTHNASWLLVMPTVLITAWISGRFSRQMISRSILATILGLGLSAFYWMPAFIEKSLVNISKLQQAQHLSYLNHFSNLEKICSERWAYSGIGTVLSVVWLLASIGLVRCPDRKRRLTGAALLVQTPLIILCCTSWSRPLWDHMEILQFVQFPWRLTAMAGLTAAAAAPALLYLCPKPFLKYLTVGVIILGLMVTATLQTQRPIFKFDDAAGLCIRHLCTSGTTTVVADEYLPLTVTQHPEKTYGVRSDTWIPETSGTICVPDQDLTHRITGFIISDEPASVRINCLYFPGWRATVDGREIPVEVIEPTGLMRLLVPAGDHEVILIFGNTPVRTLAIVITLVCGIIMVLLWLKTPRKPTELNGSTAPAETSL